MSDICVELSGTLLNFRVGGIILSDEQILLCRLTEESWWYPPGGRIRTGESSLAAIHRELEEELEGEWEVTSLKATAENFFDYRGQLCQEFCVFLRSPVAFSSEQTYQQVTRRFLLVPSGGSHQAGYQTCLFCKPVCPVKQALLPFHTSRPKP